MDGGWFILSTFLFSTVLFGDKHPRLILLSASRASPVYSYGGYAFLPFFILYKSLLREITLQCCERLRFNVARDYASSLWEITLRCYSDYISIWIIQSAVRFDRRYEWTADGLFSRRFFFQLFFLAIKNPRPILLSASRASPVDSYGGYATPPFFHTLQFNVTRDYNSMLREITLRCYERLQFNVARDYFSIWIIQSAVTFDRRYDWTADGLFSRRFFFQLFFLAINIPVQSYSPLRVLRRSILTAVMRPFPFFHTLQFNVARDYNSMLLRSRFIITRYHASSLWVITLHHYEISRFDVARDYNSMLREITIQCCERLL
jgi:hypothetical protein